MPITGSVGKGGVNQAADVQVVEQDLARHRQWLAPMPALVPDGVCNAETVGAIVKFQGTAAALEKAKCTGLVSAKGFTFKRLELGFIPFPKHKIFTPVCWAHGPTLTQADFNAAATAIGCEAAVLQALAAKETGDRGAFDPIYGRPTILYERHLFAKHSKNVWNQTHPDIANTHQGGYGKYSIQYAKLYRAATLDEPAALKSASWGLFQILGENHVAAGFSTVDAFVDAMITGEQAHLRALVAFTNAPGNGGLKKAFQNKDWAKIARTFNGPGYAKNNYDTDLAKLYTRFAPPKAPPLPGVHK